MYTAWGDKTEHAFPLRFATGIWNMGSIPVITWEPWLSVFDSARHVHLPLRTGAIATASRQWPEATTTFTSMSGPRTRFASDTRSFIRFAHEMNDPYRYPWGPQNNTKEDFIAAWRHVVDRFRRAGANNVLWVWSPHVAYRYWDLYYPGPDTVDWVATGALNFGPIAQWSRWWQFSEIFGPDYPRLSEFDKPMMVAEFGSLAVGGDRQAWYRDALTELPTHYPQVRALLFFHAAADQTVTYQKVDWTITRDAPLRRTITEAIQAYSSVR